MFGFNVKLAVLALVCLFQVIAAEENKVKEAMVKLVKECQEKTGASDADLDALRARKLPESKEGVCMFECFFAKSKVMVDGKYSKEGLVAALTPLMHGDEAKVEKLKEMSVTCEKELGAGGADKCETAKMVMECTAKKGKEFGFEYPNDF